MKRRRVLGTLAALFSTMGIMMPSTAQAQNNTCVNADYIFLGEAAQYFTNANTSHTFTYNSVDGTLTGP